MCTVRVLSVGAVIFYVTPILITLVIPLGYVYYRVQVRTPRVYRSGPRTHNLYICYYYYYYYYNSTTFTIYYT